ncbi:MAG: GNAT family N-acetyltransferase [Pseudomonadales bacterium]|nr:GNAT family N-acetyltransferase [Pseudomonadales bacterium]NRA14829.1 GNAT family N-acetyltransferase [Oceanospirillaceae bacterium]
MIIRRVTISDAGSLLKLMYQLDTETQFMLMEVGERTTTVEQQAKIIESFSGSSSKVMLVAGLDEEILGFVVGVGNSAKRNQHAMYCVIGVCQNAAGRGLGSKLLSELQQWAIKHDFSRLELTVMEHNKRAQALYLSHGFAIEGTKRNALLIDGAYVNELYMAKLLAV